MTMQLNKTILVIVCLFLLFLVVYKYHNNHFYKTSTTNLVDGRKKKLASKNNWIEKMEKKYKKTNERIREVCKKNLEQKKARFYVDNNYKQKMLTVAMLMDASHGLANCLNAKVGSSTWLNNFVNLLPPGAEKKSFKLAKSNGKDIRYSTTFMSKFNIPKEWINHFNKLNTKEPFLTALEKKFESKKILSFSFVRHPFERLVSAYKDKVLSKKCCKGQHKIRCCKGYYMKSSKRWSPTIQAWYMKNDRTFPAFVELVLKENKNLAINPHWRPFYLRCFYCDLTYNVIGRMETFNEDFRYIILKKNLKGAIPLNPSRENQAANPNIERKQESLNYFSQLSRLQIQQLYKHLKCN